jgi:hypothetical protein
MRAQSRYANMQEGRGGIGGARVQGQGALASVAWMRGVGREVGGKGHVLP